MSEALAESGITITRPDKTGDSDDWQAELPEVLRRLAIAAGQEESSDEDGEDQPANAQFDDGEMLDDPVRMYLREMGSVELLSREGEIAIAKRIEAGRQTMISGICESPLTMRAIIEWREALSDGQILLRDVIDPVSYTHLTLPTNREV